MKKSFINRFLVLAIAALLLTTLSCAPKLEYEPNPETEIPEDFLTYTNEDVFSISYPSDWVENNQIIKQTEQKVKKWLVDKIDNEQLDQAKILFLAGLPVGNGMLPNAVVVIEPLPKSMSIDEVVDSQVKGIKKVVSDYDEKYRVKTTIDNRDAGLVEYRGDFFKKGNVSHNLLMVTIIDDTVWTITCTTIEGLTEFNDHESDLLSIVRSFRSLQI